MSDELTPKELARIKMLARSRRIGLIRKRVAVLGLSLAALFSGAIMVRSQIDQLSPDLTAALSEVALVTGSDDHSGQGNAGTDSGAALSGSVSPSTNVAPSTTQSAPLVTSQS